jgi:hypothetical protein
MGIVEWSHAICGMPNNAASMGGFVTAEAAGKVKWNVAPTPAVAVGPDPSAMRFHDRHADCQAHAAALWFRSKERINIWSALPRGSPEPVSFTETSLWPSSPNCDFTVTTPAKSFIASMPFSIKFISTC